MTDISINDSKELLALHIIAGISPAWPWWKVFCPDNIPPKYDQRDSNSFAQHRDEVSLRVRREACLFIANRLNDGVVLHQPWVEVHEHGPGCEKLDEPVPAGAKERREAEYDQRLVYDEASERWLLPSSPPGPYSDTGGNA